MTNLSDLQIQSYILFKPDTDILHASDIGHFTVTLERRMQRDKISKWGIFNNSNVLSKSDENFIYERFPSERTDESLNDTRFDSAEEALVYWETKILDSYQKQLQETLNELIERKKQRMSKS